MTYSERPPDSILRSSSGPRWMRLARYPGGPFRFIAKYWVIKFREDVGLGRPLGPHMYLLHEAMRQGGLSYEGVGTSEQELASLVEQAEALSRTLCE